MEEGSPQSSVNEVHGQQRPLLRPNFSWPTPHLISKASRTLRPRPTEYQCNDVDGGKVPLQPERPEHPERPKRPESVKRQPSKSGLRSLFGKEKLSGRSNDERKHPETKKAQAGLADNRSKKPLSPPMNPKSSVTMSAGVVNSGPAKPTETSTALMAKPGMERSMSGPAMVTWKPPPLFQAYPQATKHDYLWAPVMSVDSILRLHAHGTKNNAKEDEISSNVLHNDHLEESSNKKLSKDVAHARSASGSSVKFEWAQKIYVLTTTGHILQYAGDGKHDRFPEKMMQLGSSSVAFASDAVPAAALESTKPLPSRFGFHLMHSRRIVRNFLLVFSNADKMNSWLVAIRAAIEAQSGKRYASEKSAEPDLLPSESNTVMRQPVARDPKRVSSLFLQSNQEKIPEENDNADQMNQDVSTPSRRSSYHSTNRRSIVIAHKSIPEASADALPSPSSALKINREHSFSRSRTPQPCLARVNSNEHEAASNATSSNGSAQRMSMSSQQIREMMMSSPPPEAAMTTTVLPHRQSSFVASARSTSPPTPNFSVPSFSTRFGARLGQIQDVLEPSTASLIWNRGYFSGPEKAHSQVVVAHSGDGNARSVNPTSPPLSPTNTVTSVSASSGYELTYERLLCSPQPTVSRPLHVSNSQDSLVAAMQKNMEFNRTQPSMKLPRVSISAASSVGTASSSSTTLRQQSNMVLHKVPDLLGESTSNPEGSVPSQNEGPLSDPAVLSWSKRSSIYRQLDATSLQSVSHRKSMIELSLGPPCGPPPTCPLPELPFSSDNNTPSSKNTTDAGTYRSAAPSRSSSLSPDSGRWIQSPSTRRSSLFVNG